MMHSLYENGNESNFVDTQRERIFDESIPVTLDTIKPDLYLKNEIIKHIYKLSYVAEGIRSCESLRKNKHGVEFKTTKKKSIEVYENRIKNEIKNKNIPSLMLNEKTYYDLSYNKNSLKPNINKFKQWSIPRAERVVYFLDKTNEYTKRYVAQKN